MDQMLLSKDIDANTFEEYQHFANQTIAHLTNQLALLESKLNVFTNLLEISQYINQYMKNKDLLPMINDILIGVLGAKYSTIYLKSNGEYIPVTTTTNNLDTQAHLDLIHLYTKDWFIINDDKPIFNAHSDKSAIYSCLGVPIQFNCTPLGFIIIEHQKKDYFTSQHASFLLALTQHIAIAIENNILYNQIKEIASIDGLTNLFNKKYFFDTIHEIPHNETLNYALVMIDIDNFKQINDTYGHPYGDEVLKTIAAIIKKYTRPTDIVARYGGEEIIIFFDQFTDATLVYNRLELIRSKIAETMIPGDCFTSSVTASFGGYIKEDENLTLETVVKYADQNLYTSKRKGKNTITLNK